MTEYTKTHGGDCKLPRQPVLREEIQKGDKEGKGPPVLQKKKLDKRVSTLEKNGEMTERIYMRVLASIRIYEVQNKHDVRCI